MLLWRLVCLLQIEIVSLDWNSISSMSRVMQNSHTSVAITRSFLWDCSRVVTRDKVLMTSTGLCLALETWGCFAGNQIERTGSSLQWRGGHVARQWWFVSCRERISGIHRHLSANCFLVSSSLQTIVKCTLCSDCEFWQKIEGRNLPQVIHIADDQILASRQL